MTAQTPQEPLPFDVEEEEVLLKDQVVASPAPSFSVQGIYSAIKEGTLKVPYGIQSVDTLLAFISGTSKFVADKTNLNVHFSVDNIYDLMNKLDEILQEQLIHVDDGLGELRGKVIVRLHELLSVLSQYKNSTKTVLDTRYETFALTLQDVVKVVKTKYPAAYHNGEVLVTKSYDNLKTAAEVTSQYIEVSKNKFVDVYDVGQSSLTHAYDEGKNTVERSREQLSSTLYGTVFYALKLAQPYVHRAVTTSTPYVSKAIEISQPYVTKAKPFLEPIVDKASGYQHTLEEHQVVGPYVKKGVDLAQVIFNETTAYAIPAAAAE